MNPHLALVDEPQDSLRAVLLQGLVVYNSTVTAPGWQVTPLAVSVTCDGEVVGGLWGRTGMGWLTIELIFVPENLRGRTIASQVIALAETEALRRGCHSAWLETLNPRARRLYEKLGFVCFAELSDYPEGNVRAFMQKPLKPTD